METLRSCRHGAPRRSRVCVVTPSSRSSANAASIHATFAKCLLTVSWSAEMRGKCAETSARLTNDYSCFTGVLRAPNRKRVCRV